MTSKRRPVLLLSCLSVVFAFSPSPSLAAAQSGDSFKIRADVDLVTVEVTALDKKGNPVRNLKKEDFQLYEDGQKQEILSIDEVNAASEASPSGVNPISGATSHRGKTVLIVFADNLLKPGDTQTSRDSAEKFVREHMRPQDLFAVAKFDISMKILQNFTSDRKDVLDGIRQAAGVSVNGHRGLLNELLRALDRINYSLAQIKGQKSILIYADPFVYADPFSNSSTSTASLIPDLAVPRLPNDPPPKSSHTVSGGWGVSLYQSDLISDVVYYNVELATMGGGERRILGDRNVLNGNNEAELDRLDQKLSNYYILGFRSGNPKHNGAIRKLEVRTKLSGLTLKYQYGYLDRRPVDALANTKQETTLLTALATPGTATQLPIIFRAAYFYDSPRIAKVLVASRISLEKAAFMKKGAQLGTELRIMGVVYGEDGSIAARFSETLPVSFEKEKEAEFRKRDLAYRNYFSVRPGKYRLKLAVSDESGNLGSMERLLEIPVLPERGFAGSSLLVAEQASPLPDLISNLQSQMLDESNPLLYAGFQIEPSVENKMPANATLPVMFRLYNLPGTPDQWSLTAKARMIDEKGKEYSLGTIPLKNMMSVAGNAEAAVALSLPFKDVPPGKYRLIIEASEAASAETTMLETDLELTSPTSR
jgi:hypothetical protein